MLWIDAHAQSVIENSKSLNNCIMSFMSRIMTGTWTLDTGSTAAQSTLYTEPLTTI